MATGKTKIDLTRLQKENRLEGAGRKSKYGRVKLGKAKQNTHSHGALLATDGDPCRPLVFAGLGASKAMYLIVLAYLTPVA